MKILHVYRTYYPDPPGGLQEAIRQICLALGSRGHENTIFTLSPRAEPGRIVRPEADVVRERSYAAPASCDLGGPAAFSTFRRLAEDADLVHWLHPWPFADVIGEVVRPRRAQALTYVSDIVRQRVLGRLYAPLLERTLARVDVVVANSPDYAATSPVLSRAAIEKKTVVAPLGLVEEKAPDPDPAVLDKLGLRGRPFFLFLGVLRYYKGLRFLAEAARGIDLPIVIAGDGPERRAIEATTRAEGGDVRLAGFVTESEKRALLEACRALVLPSHLRSEAFGMVLVEAAMLGKPLVTAEIGTGTSYVNAAGETGFVVRAADARDLAAALSRLAQDDELVARMGRAARLRYERHFSGEVVGLAYERAFERARESYAAARRL